MRPTYLQTMRVMLAAIVVLFATLQSFAQGLLFMPLPAIDTP